MSYGRTCSYCGLIVVGKHGKGYSFCSRNCLRNFYKYESFPIGGSINWDELASKLEGAYEELAKIYSRSQVNT